ncbi:MAG: guanylate kinase [Actinomycetales bacterium]|nr:guanylate kinase [Actinomycetales bacterium]
MLARSPRVIVIVGPSGVGKGTVVRALLDRYPEIWLSVSATTRPPRPGEVDGEHYYFVAPGEFDELVAAGDMLEWAQVYGLHKYGTIRHAVLEHLAGGHPVLLELDLDGARQVRQTMPEALTVFLAPPSLPELRRRLESRGTEGPEERDRRLATAERELAAQDEFDAVVVNDDVDQAVIQLASLLGLPER